MRQFDVCSNPSAQSRAYAPFVVCLQSHLIDAIPTCVVAPMLIAEGRKGYTQVSAKVAFDGAEYFVSVAELAAIDGRKLRAAGSLRDFEDQIRAALSRVFTGF